MGKKHKIFNLIILDESGSMETIKTSIISGFNELIQTIKGVAKKYPNQEHLISLVSFNGLGIKTLLELEHVEKLNLLDQKNYHPQADTPLFDAIGQSVAKLKKVTNLMEDANVLITILTDGEENSSKEYSGQAIKTIIDELKTKNWTFTYIGANHDVEKFASSISITNTLHFEADNEGVADMFVRETASRIRYSDQLQSKKGVSGNYFDEDPQSKE